MDQASSGSAIPAFCQEYYNQTGRIPVILHVCDGGSSIFETSEWNPAASGSNYSDDVVNILSNAETHLGNLGWDIGKKSVLSHQGEADSETAVQTYKDKFLSLVDKFLNNGYEYVFYYEISERDTNDLDQVRQAQRLAHQERDNLYMVFSCANFYDQGFTTDGTHYTQDAYNLMGRQGAKSIANNVINNLQNNWYLSKARTDVDMNLNQIKGVSGAQTNNFNIANDAVLHYTPANNLGNLMVTANGNVAHVLFDLATPDIQLSTQLGSNIAVSTGSASGTTGSDNVLTIFADSTNGRLTFENRLGQIEDVRFLHLL